MPLLIRAVFRVTLAGLLLAWPAGLLAQPRPGEGVVVDTSGAPIPGARIRVESGGTLVAETVANGAGIFRLDEARPETVTVVVSAQGFADTARQVTLPAARGALEFVLHSAGLAEAVTVTATRGVEQLAAVASASVLTSSDLATTAAPAIDDALRHTPGFSLFRRTSSRVANPSAQGVTLRGLAGSGASRTLVLADGLPLNDPFGSWVYWNRVPQASVDRVEVVRGASGDLYGADALGGVVQVLTLQPSRGHLRAIAEGGAHGTWRGSAFASGAREGWEAGMAGEWLDTDGVYVVAAEDRGLVDVPAWSDYRSAVLTAGHRAASWRAHVRASLYSEVRGNGTALVGNDTNGRQFSAETSGTAGSSTWSVRGAGGTQDYFNNFSAVAAGRNAERKTSEQRVPMSFVLGSGQWTLAHGRTSVLAGGEMKSTRATMHEVQFPAAGGASIQPDTGGEETVRSVFARAHVVLGGTLTAVAGARGDFWKSTPLLAASPGHDLGFVSPRGSISWQVRPSIALHASAYRAYRTPTLNELHRGFRVGNTLTEGNPLLGPERLTGVETGALVSGRGWSARITAFLNHLDDVVTNVTIRSSPTLILRQKQNADRVRAAGVEVEADVRPHRVLTLTGLVALTDSTFRTSAALASLAGNRIPQVPEHQLGAGVTFAEPRWFTASIQVRVVGNQYDDDLNTFRLEGFTAADAYIGRSFGRAQVFGAIENIADVEYDTGRTPVRTIGWPRTARAGVRVFLP